MHQDGTNDVNLNANHRCDRCGAQAYLLAMKNQWELLFCLHHAKQYSLDLETTYWTLYWDFDALESIMPGQQVPV